VTDTLRPAADWELQEMVARAARDGQGLEVQGRGSLRSIGRAVSADVVLTTASLRGVTLYEPTELVMSARTGTTLAEIESELASRGQMLAFEPMDVAPAIGHDPGRLTIGGVFATNLSGSRRIATGGARDHLLGVGAVNGRGELFKSGGRVMKNVTGLDVARALTGSWGTLAVLTEVTFKVVPRPETAVTLVYSGLADELAIEALTTAMGTPYEVSGAAHVQKAVASRMGSADLASHGTALTLLRVETFASGIAERAEKLAAALSVYGKPMMLGAIQTAEVWQAVRTLSMLPYTPDKVLWRISTAPGKAAGLVAALQKVFNLDAVYDWSGGLIWLELPATADAGAADVRRAVAVRGGHATLFRAAPDVRLTIDVFEPLKPAVERLTRDLKAAFDPAGILNRGRMYAGV
jgi:glycolate oxidase FAD binding subunit